MVKFLQNPQSPLVLANEWLATQLAIGLGLPVPQACIVDVSASFLASNPICAIHEARPNIAYQAGLHFGSRYVGGLLRDQPVDYPSQTLLTRLEDPLVFAGALAFDKWVCNADVRQCVFLQTRSGPQYLAYLIDHGHCFDLHWSLKDSPLKGSYCRKSVYGELTGRESFEPWLSRIEAFPIETIEAAAKTIPTEWYSAGTIKLAALLDDLVRRRSRVWELIQDTRTASPDTFPLWK